MPILPVFTSLNTRDIIWHLSRELDHEELIAFVTALDEQVADVDFTETLIDSLQTALNEELHPK